MRKDIMKYINSHVKKHGYPPLTQNDIAKKLGVHRSSIRYHFDFLRDELIQYPEYRRYFK